MKKIIMIGLIMLLCINFVSAGKIKYQVRILGTSMNPIINDNSKVYVNTVDKNTNLIIGDIICYNPDKREFVFDYRYVCHRIIDIKDNTYLTAGDNNAFADYYVLRRDIAYKVVDIK